MPRSPQSNPDAATVPQASPTVLPAVMSLTPTPPADAGPRRIHELILPWVQATPDAPALADAQGQLSYRQLDECIATTRDHLAAAGLQPGDRLLVVGENCNAAALFVLACSALDAWVAMVNARLSEREIDTFIDHSGARLVVFLDDASPEARAHAARCAARSCHWPGTGPFSLSPVRPEVDTEPVLDAADEQVAAIIYTSGTSGQPKGVMLTHANLMFIARNSCRMRALQPHDRIYGVLPMSHVYGLTALLLASLCAGARLSLVPRFDPGHLAEALAQDGITVMHGVPAMYARLLEWSRRPGHRLLAPSLRVAQSGGAPLDQALKDSFEAALGVVLHNGYGMTEASPSIAQTRLDAPRRDCSVGPPIPGIEVRVVDLDTGRKQPDGETGELQVRGPNVMKGYYRNEPLSHETVDAQGWLHTGDLARIAPDGTLEIVGRCKELIIRSGFNVYPVEVEQVLCSHPDVVLAAVVGRAVPGNEEVIAFVEPVPGATLDLEALERFLRERLSPYKLPARIVPMPRLPASATGKIFKSKLREIAAELGPAAAS